jgi:hypothetical protein
MKNSKSFILTAFLFITVMGCKGQKTQERQVGPFDRLKLSGIINVIYSNSDSSTVMIKAVGTDPEKVQTKVENSVLTISVNEKSGSSITVYIKNTNLKSVETSGVSSFKSTNTIKSDSIEFMVSGASGVQATLETEKVLSRISGAGSLILDGNADTHKAEASGAGALKCYGLITKNTNVMATGAASVRVYTTYSLQANAGGASSIKIKGDPQFVNSESGSSASIVRIKSQSKDESRDADTTVYELKRKKLLVININDDKEDVVKKCIDDDDFKHWAGFSMGINGYMNAANQIGLGSGQRYMDLDYRKSLNFQLNIIESQLKIVNHHFKINTGIGFDFRGFEFSNKTNLNPDSSFTYGVIDSSGTFSYKKNKLRAAYIQVPLLFELNSSKLASKSFHVAFGVIGQYLLASRTKQKLEMDGYQFKKIKKDNYNLNPFLVKAHVNFGYRGWTVFGEYSFSPLFQNGKGPELYPFTAGIRLIPFG